MSNWVRAAELPLDVNLSEITHYLIQHGVAHRISEEQQKQVIWCADEYTASIILQVLQYWQAGKLHLSPGAGGPQPVQNTQLNIAAYIKLNPLTLLLIIISIFGALLVYVDPTLTWVKVFTFQDIFFSHGLIGFIELKDSLASGQIWRLWTPMFLHFSGFHILFNSLWLWELGRRVERLHGPLLYGLLIIVVSLSSNCFQYWFEGPSLFGGMSGVIYGLLGYIWMRQKFNPHPLLAVPMGMIIFMLVWLFACVFGLANIFMDDKVANGAHIGGLVAGMIIGAWPKQLLPTKR